MRKWQTLVKKQKRDLKKLKRNLDFKRFRKNKNRINNSISAKDKERNILIKREKERLIRDLNKYHDYTFIKGPETLSIIENPSKTIRFINKLKRSYNHAEKVFVDLSEVNKINHDAIVILLSIMIRFKSKKIRFNGNFPKTAQARNLLIESGFFTHLVTNFKESKNYEIGKKDSILTHGNLIVDSELAGNMLLDASKTILGKSIYPKGAFRVLQEIMHNTVSHAKGGEENEAKHWWLSINHDVVKKVVKISFVDFGIGVFKSLVNTPENSKWSKGIELFKSFVAFDRNDAFFREILEGQIHASVTGHHYRGKGIPGVNQVFKRDQIKKLFILTNNVCFDGEKNELVKMNDWFEGTFYYFELNNDCYGKE